MQDASHIPHAAHTGHRPGGVRPQATCACGCVRTSSKPRRPCSIRSGPAPAGRSWCCSPGSPARTSSPPCSSPTCSRACTCARSASWRSTRPTSRRPSTPCARLERRLRDNPSTRRSWRKRSDFIRYVGRAEVTFLSGERGGQRGGRGGLAAADRQRGAGRRAGGVRPQVRAHDRLHQCHPAASWERPGPVTRCWRASCAPRGWPSSRTASGACSCTTRSDVRRMRPGLRRARGRAGGQAGPRASADPHAVLQRGDRRAGRHVHARAPGDDEMRRTGPFAASPKCRRSRPRHVADAPTPAFGGGARRAEGAGGQAPSSSPSTSPGRTRPPSTTRRSRCCATRAATRSR